MSFREDWTPTAKQLGGLVAAGGVGALIGVAARQPDIQWSAWVSAFAAVVQAVAASIAIWYTGKLARESADRERAAEVASVARSERAERVAVERADRLAKEAAERVEEDEREAFNSPLISLIDLANSARAIIAERIDALSVQNHDQYILGELPIGAAQARDNIAPFRERLTDVIALAATTQLDHALRRTYANMARTSDVVHTYSQRLPEIDQVVESLKSRLKSASTGGA